MKTKRITLYIDLEPYWQDRRPDEWMRSASTKPYEYPPLHSMRVAFEVDLPHVETTFGADVYAEKALLKGWESRDTQEKTRIVEDDKK